MSSSTPAPVSKAWLIPCVHQAYITKRAHHDFSVLATGAPDDPPSLATAHNWLGGFSGRPTLLADLMPALRSTCVNTTLRGGVVKRNALVSFWRFLDGYEDYMSSQGIQVKRVQRLHDITAMHLEMYSTPGPQGSWIATKDARAATLRSIVRTAISDQELPELILSTFRVPPVRKETPNQESGLGLIRFLRNKVHGVLARWRLSDELAAKGTSFLRGDLASSSALDSMTEADAHATYRALVRSTNNPVPSLKEFMSALGLERRDFPEYWPRHGDGHSREGQRINMTDLASGLFPTSGDVAVFYLLFLARSAWNPATVASLNIASWNSPYDSEHEWLFAPKERAGGSLQWTVANSNPTSCFSIVTSLIGRSAPLREYALRNVASSSLPDVSARSPWVGVTVKAGRHRIYVVDPYDTRTINNWLEQLTQEYNLTVSKEKRVARMTSSDFRDLAAAAIYKDSQYSAWVTMLLLGHKNIATFRAYGFRRASYAESFRLLSGVVEDVFGQIKVKRRFDITLTRAKLIGMKVSRADIERLENARRHRTSDGAGCADPYNPPIEIDPGNRRNGCDLCVQQHRCIGSGCPNAFVFSDSLSGMSKRVAELEHIKSIVGAVRFDASSDAGDLLTLRYTLRQWKPDEVAVAVGQWHKKISAGTHKVMMFAGQH